MASHILKHTSSLSLFAEIPKPENGLPSMKQKIGDGGFLEELWTHKRSLGMALIENARKRPE